MVGPFVLPPILFLDFPIPLGVQFMLKVAPTLVPKEKGGGWIDKRTIGGERKSLLEKKSAERGKTEGWNGGGRTGYKKSERRAKLQQKTKRKNAPSSLFIP